jgi:hypothetical protein
MTYLLINLGNESLFTYTLIRSKKAMMNLDSRKKMPDLCNELGVMKEGIKG